MKVVAEELYVADRGRGDSCVGKVPREEDEGDVADVLRVRETREVTNFKRRDAGGVEYLWSTLYGR